MSLDLALKNRNPANGRFNLSWDPVTKDVLFDDSEEHAVMSQLVEWRARWWADSDGTHGSRLNEIKQLTRSTASDAEAAAREALEFLVDQQLITVLRVMATVPPVGSGGRFVVTVFWSKRGSPTQERTTKVLI
jgi:phage gp46-like protein